MKKLLCPSMMCANYDSLRDEVNQLDDAGIDIFHCDVMDGGFVSNMSMGLQDIICIRRNTKKMVDCHLMVENPGFAGQAYIEFVTNKIRKLVNLKHKYHYQLIIDGACSPQRIRELSDIGCDGFILGTSALFGKEKKYQQVISELRKEI